MTQTCSLRSSRLHKLSPETSRTSGLQVHFTFVFDVIAFAQDADPNNGGVNSPARDMLPFLNPGGVRPRESANGL
ncbi:MAG: hypothetical protein QOE70_5182 [Chthoniobacter sp.]|nr:hypothetical protein [Chthoniobacter sp.]